MSQRRLRPPLVVESGRVASVPRDKIRVKLPPIIDAWNTKDPDQVVALYAPNGVRHQFALPEARLEGRDAIRPMVAALMHSTPNFVLTERQQMEHGDRRVVEWNWSGTIEGRAQAVDLNGISIVRFQE
jgi:uncharacterized protein (TIGR02246 family)